MYDLSTTMDMGSANLPCATAQHQIGSLAKTSIDTVGHTEAPSLQLEPISVISPPATYVVNHVDTDIPPQVGTTRLMYTEFFPTLCLPWSDHRTRQLLTGMSNHMYTHCGPAIKFRSRIHHGAMVLYL
eukprot:COSAG01_NODE_28546_length_658_cov_1.892665_1_plen_127_part_10